MCLMLQPMSIILAKLITAMTKEGKFKDAIQDKIGATVDTTDLKKQLSVLNASLHQAETIKTRLEQQMDNLDVTDTHYDKKISDLQRRLDAQYDRIDEVEETMAELKSLLSLGDYYVYGLIDPRSKQIFYIGKGTKNRVFEKSEFREVQE